MNYCHCLKNLFLILIFSAILAVTAFADKGNSDTYLTSSNSGVAESDTMKMTSEAPVGRVLQDEGAKTTQPSQELPSPQDASLNDGKTLDIAIIGNERKITLSNHDGLGGTVGPSLSVSLPTNQTGLNAIERSVTLFTERLRERFSLWLERSSRYLEIMKEILKEKKLPEEIVFLPIIESGFNLNAYSKARAVGPWQFIEATAKRYGLVVDWWRDERKDPVKSTKAAAAYLNDLYTMFGSWNLALAAYNAGEGKISRALKRSDAGDYWSLLLTKQIRNETKEYVPRFIAATMIANTPEDYGFRDLVYNEPLEYDEVKIDSPLDLAIIAQCAGTSVKDIRDLNPELRRWSTPPDVSSYTLRIPKGHKTDFMESLTRVPVEDRFSCDTYTVKRGENVKKIANKLNVPVGAIIAVNSMTGIEQLRTGDIIKIPPKEKYSPDLDDRISAKKVAYNKKIPTRQRSCDKSGRGNSRVISGKSREKVRVKKV